jgi:hypothetical protein
MHFFMSEAKILVYYMKFTYSLITYYTISM